MKAAVWLVEMSSSFLITKVKQNFLLKFLLVILFHFLSSATHASMKTRYDIFSHP